MFTRGLCQSLLCCEQQKKGRSATEIGIKRYTVHLHFIFENHSLKLPVTYKCNILFSAPCNFHFKILLQRLVSPLRPVALKKQHFFPDMLDVTASDLVLSEDISALRRITLVQPCYERHLSWLSPVLGYQQNMSFQRK